MKEELESYNLLYEYAKKIDSDEFRSLNGDQNYEFKIKGEKENIEDPYDEENWGDVTVKIVSPYIFIDNEKLNLNVNKGYDLLGLIQSKKADKRKNKLIKALKKIK